MSNKEEFFRKDIELRKKYEDLFKKFGESYERGIWKYKSNSNFNIIS